MSRSEITHDGRKQIACSCTILTSSTISENGSWPGRTPKCRAFSVTVSTDCLLGKGVSNYCSVCPKCQCTKWQTEPVQAFIVPRLAMPVLNGWRGDHWITGLGFQPVIAWELVYCGHLKGANVFFGQSVIHPGITGLMFKVAISSLIKKVIESLNSVWWSFLH